MTCQLAALRKRVLSRLSWTRAGSFPNKPVAIRRGISRVFNCQRPYRSNQSVPIVGKWLRYAFCVCHAMRSGGRRDAVPTSALLHNRAFHQSDATVQKLLEFDGNHPRKRAFGRFGGSRAVSHSIAAGLQARSTQIERGSSGSGRG
jgi:hypothetical protein